MRALPLPLLLLLGLAGCTDSLGLSGNCSAEKVETRLREGRAPDETQGPSQVGGDYTERWYYYSGSQTRTYTFRWGVSYGSCQVDGGRSLARIPITG